MPKSHISFIRFIIVATFALLPGLCGCRKSSFPDVPAGYREYAYISNGGSNTVTVLDLVYLRQDHTLQVGTGPTNLAVNPVRSEIYVANTQSGTVSVIDAEANRVVATISVHRQPSFIAIDPTGHRAYVANSGSNSVSILDLDRRREISVAGAGEQPVQAHVSPDGRTVVVTNHGSGSVSLFAVTPYDSAMPSSGVATHLRSTFSGCPGAADTVILPDSSKAFVACAGGHQVMAIGLAAAAGSWAAKQNSSLMTDHLLALLDVGKTPVHLAMKPDGGEIFVSNYDSDSFSEISTWTNEVGGTYEIGNRPVWGIVTRDNSTLWVANSGADSIGVYSIDDGKLAGSVRTGSEPKTLAFSEDEHLLLAADTRSGDVAVIRTAGKQGPALFTILPAGISPHSIVVKALRAK